MSEFVFTTGRAPDKKHFSARTRPFEALLVAFPLDEPVSADQ